MKRILPVLLCLMVSTASATAQIRISPDDKGRTFEGIGALSAGASSRLLPDYPAEQQAQILDLLFKPKFGASLHHLKVEIGGDVNSTSGTEPSHQRTRQEQPDFTRGYEWWLMKEARRRNPSIFLDCLQWGSPGWIGDGQYYSQDNIDYIVSFLHGADSVHGLRIDYTGIRNERLHDTEFVKNLKQALLQRGLSHVGIVGSDLCCHSQWTIANDMIHDPALAEAVDVIGDHYPETDWGYNTSDNAKKTGKPLWNSEGGPWKGNWEGFAALAKLYNRDYVIGKMTKTITWSLITSYYENLALPNSGLMKANTPWSGHYEVEPALWAAAHTTQFTAPGWIYIENGCGLNADSTVSYVTLMSPDEQEFTIVIETIDAQGPQHLTIELPQRVKRLTQWRSIVDQESFIRQPDLRPRNGHLTLTLAPHALYTFSTTTGQQKGSFPTPDSTPFPLPYTETFDHYPPHATPRYISDQGGAFEVVPRIDGQGMALRQQITRPCIEWEGAVLNQTVVGDPTWQDYTVSVDICLEKSYSWGSVSGRVSETHRSHSEPEAYTLRIFTNGNWQLLSGDQVLDHGLGEFRPGKWYNLRLSLHGDQITASIDGTTISTVTDTKHTHGMIGMMTSFHHVAFDNLIVTP